MVADPVPLVDLHLVVPLEEQSPEADEALQDQLVTGGDVPVQDSIFEFSRSWPGREIDHTVVELIPAVAPVLGTTLQIEDGTPFMRLMETHYSVSGEPVAMSEVHVDDRYVRFHVVRHD